jgi:hypothetical protein
LKLLLGESPVLSRAKIASLLDDDGTDAAMAELAADEEGSDAEEVLESELGVDLDARIDRLFAEIAQRQRAGGSVYPFEQQGKRRLVARDAAGADSYLLLLVLSLEDAPFRREKRTSEVERAYDKLAAEALRRFLGRNAKAVRFARSSHDPEDPENTRPKRFDKAIAWLRDKLDLGPGVDRPPKHEEVSHWEDPQGLTPLRSYKDAGVDVVAWWHFKDERIGFPVLLAQCTVQVRWERKLKDVDPDLWRGWINFGTVPPQKCLVIPFAVDLEEERWPNRITQAGVIIDRVRFIELLDELADEQLSQLVTEETRAWLRAELEALA